MSIADQLSAISLISRLSKYGPAKIVNSGVLRHRGPTIEIEHGDVVAHLGFKDGVLAESDWQIMKSPARGGDAFTNYMRQMADRFATHCTVWFHHHIGRGGTSEHAHLTGLTSSEVEFIIANMPYIFTGETDK